MPIRNYPIQTTQAAISVSEMARRVTLSRGRFYELIEAGVFPPPCYCPHTRRALYPADLQRQCLEIRETQMGANGQYVLFYGKRSVNAVQGQAVERFRRGTDHHRNRDSALAAYRDGLTALGMGTLTDDQIRSAIQAAYPSGTNGIDSGTVLAAIFRLMRRPNVARSLTAT